MGTSATSNRDRFPGFGEFVDDLRSVFGRVKVRHVVNRETGEELGRPHEGTTVVASASGSRVEVKKPAPKGRAATTRYR